MNQEDCDVILEKGVEVEIYPRGNPKNDCEGVARLIECVEVNKTKECWMVQFKDEHRLFKRVIKKPEGVEASPDPLKELKMTKRIVNGEVRYLYTNKKTSRKSILGMERTTHSEVKYLYNRTRNKFDHE